MEKKELKKGYTTGVFASLAFKSALEAYIVSNQTSTAITHKNDNDDLDVTKGCEISIKVAVSTSFLELNTQSHEPHIFINGSNKMAIYAGKGVGVVTKKGLKTPPNFAAINPKPLESMENIFNTLTNNSTNLNMYCSVSVTNGEELAKKTANAKVGVIGGISILGTKGIVKPVSSSAYIDSIATEILFAKSNAYELLVFTLGNSALKVAQERYEESQIIEIGNFVYDSIKIAQETKVRKVLFLCGIGKMTKVYQGFENTHNRFGTIDFIRLKKEIEEELDYSVDIESTKTVKGISEELERNSLPLLEKFYTMITHKANEQINDWFSDIDVEAVILEQSEVKGW
jgi:cobalt-precorrin-5B (C1)-methyltransferase